MYPGVEGICVTCKKFVLWLEQLADCVTVNTTLHIDGLHKLHYGPNNWIVLALGTHCLSWDTTHGKPQYRQSFRPLVLMVCKQIETIESVKYMMDVRPRFRIADCVPLLRFRPVLLCWQALKRLCSHFSISFEACNFAAAVYDRCYGFMKGMREDGCAEVTCWPHIKGAKRFCLRLCVRFCVRFCLRFCMRFCVRLYLRLHM